MSHFQMKSSWTDRTIYKITRPFLFYKLLAKGKLLEVPCSNNALWSHPGIAPASAAGEYSRKLHVSVITAEGECPHAELIQNSTMGSACLLTQARSHKKIGTSSSGEATSAPALAVHYIVRIPDAKTRNFSLLHILEAPGSSRKRQEKKPNTPTLSRIHWIFLSLPKGSADLRRCCTRLPQVRKEVGRTTSCACFQASRGT